MLQPANWNSTHFGVPPSPAHTSPGLHATPHAPQLAGSCLRSTHAVPQAVSPVPHIVAHTPAEHTLPDGQTLPHAPQLLGSLAKLTHAPLHELNPKPHGDAVQTPITQSCPLPQRRPAAMPAQPPQF